MLIYPYKAGSRSVRALAQGTGSKVIKRKNSRYKYRPHKVILNWGASRMPEEVAKSCVLNHPMYVRAATCKSLAFQMLLEADVSIPEFTNSKLVASTWIQQGGVAICRKTTKGSGGDGIVVAEETEDLVDAPLYTRYIKKQSEWRVHIFNEEVIQLQRKVRNNDIPVDDVDWRIRNHDRGFIFQRLDLDPPAQVIQEALKAIEALQLDFGAVDVIYNAYHDTAYVLEVNCAPGLEGGTVQSYINAIKEIL